MEIKTVFGVTWKTPTSGEVLFVLLLLAIVIAAFILLKYRQKLINKEVNERQLFLFRMKNRGLSNFQIKIIYNIVSTLHLKKPNILLDDSHLFEKAIGKFLLFLRNQNENEDSIASIAKEIVILYEKIYHPTKIKKPLESLADLELKQMIYFLTDSKETFLGKLVKKTETKLALQLFRPANRLQSLKNTRQVSVHVWRIGDAEYTFTADFLQLQKNIAILKIPDEFNRRNEFRHPFIEVLISLDIIYDYDQKAWGTITKINDYEAVVKSSQQLDYQKEYQLYFEILEFKVHITGKLIADKTVEEEKVYYYTFKFIEMSEPARNVLKSYIYEHL